MTLNGLSPVEDWILHAYQLEKRLERYESALQGAAYILDNPCCKPCDKCQPYYDDARKPINEALKSTSEGK